MPKWWIFEVKWNAIKHRRNHVLPGTGAWVVLSFIFGGLPLLLDSPILSLGVFAFCNSCLSTKLQSVQIWLKQPIVGISMVLRELKVDKGIIFPCVGV